MRIRSSFTFAVPLILAIGISATASGGQQPTPTPFCGDPPPSAQPPSCTADCGNAGSPLWGGSWHVGIDNEPVPTVGVDTAIWSGLGDCGFTEGYYPLSACVSNTTSGPVYPTLDITWNGGQCHEVFEFGPIMFRKPGFYGTGALLYDTACVGASTYYDTYTCQYVCEYNDGYMHYSLDDIPADGKIVRAACAAQVVDPSDCSIHVTVGHAPGDDSEQQIVPHAIGTTELCFPETSAAELYAQGRGECDPAPGAFVETELRAKAYVFGITGWELPRAPQVGDPNQNPEPVLVGANYGPADAVILSQDFANSGTLPGTIASVVISSGGNSRIFRLPGSEPLQPYEGAAIFDGGFIGAVWDGYLYVNNDPNNKVPVTTPTYSVTVSGSFQNYVGGVYSIAEKGLSGSKSDAPGKIVPPMPPGNPPTEQVGEDDDDHHIDPVHLQTGEFYLPEVDIRVPGEGMDLIWAREYRSRINPQVSEPGQLRLGKRWIFTLHNASVHMMHNPSVVWDQNGLGTIAPNPVIAAIELTHGADNRIIYTRHVEQQTPEIVTYRNPHTTDYFEDPAANTGVIVLKFANGGRWEFNSQGSKSLTKIVDRNGNELDLSYGYVNGTRIVTDTMGRSLVIHNPYGLIDLVELKDKNGDVLSAVEYDYYDGILDEDEGSTEAGNIGDLKSVTKRGMLFEGGPVEEMNTTYTYSKGFSDPELNGNLLTVWDGKDQLVLRNEYYTTPDPLDIRYDRIWHQEWGNASDDIYLYYERVTPSAGNRNECTRAVFSDREGRVREYRYNTSNMAIKKTEYAGKPTSIDSSNFETVLANYCDNIANKVRPSDPNCFVTEYFWDSRDRLSRRKQPDGTLVVYIHQDELEPPPPQVFPLPVEDHQRRDNVRQIWLIPRDRAGEFETNGFSSIVLDDPNTIHVEYTYESGSCCLNTAVKTYTEPDGGSGRVWNYSYDDYGNRTSVTPPGGIPNSGSTFVYDYTHNGRLVQRIHPEDSEGRRRVDHYEYYDSSGGLQEGMLKQITVDYDAQTPTQHKNLTWTFEYNGAGAVTRVMDPKGNATDYLRNELQWILKVTSPETTTGSGVRYERRLEYDKNGNVVAVRSSNYDVNSSFAPVAASPSLIERKFEYDLLNYPIRALIRENNTDIPLAELGYDRNRRLTRIKSRLAVTGAEPYNVLAAQYDERGLLFKLIEGEGDPKQKTTQFDYTPAGNLCAVREGLEGPAQTPSLVTRVWTIGYDTVQRPWYAYDPMANAYLNTYVDHSFDVDQFEIYGELEDTSTNPALSTVSLLRRQFGYDGQGRMNQVAEEFFNPETQATLSDGLSVFEIHYAPNSALDYVEDDNGHTLNYLYDTAGRLLSLEDNLWNKSTYGYDDNSNVTSLTSLEKYADSTADKSFTTTFEYDNLNRISRMIDNDNKVTRYGFNSRGGLGRLLDARGYTTQYQYDLRNRLRTVTREHVRPAGTYSNSDYATVVTQYNYDENSRLTEAIDNNSRVTTYAYDQLNRPVSVTYADSTALSVVYNVLGDVASITDPNGSLVQNTLYDDLGRLRHRTIAPGSGVHPQTTFEDFKYDGLSRLVRAENDNAVVTRKYDSLSNLVRETLNGQPTTYTHDGVGNPLTVGYPGGRTITSTYDLLDRLSTLTEGANPLASFHYVGPGGRTQWEDFANNTRNVFGYQDEGSNDDPLGRVRSVTTIFDPNGQNPATLDQRWFQWDETGNRTAHNDPVHETLRFFQYDSLGRIAQSILEIGPNSDEVKVHTYSLDGAQNLLSDRLEWVETGGIVRADYTLSAAVPPADAQVNQITSIAKTVVATPEPPLPVPTGQRGHDLNGNLQSDEFRNCQYDYLDRLVEVEMTSEGIWVQYEYDPLGRRIERRVVEAGIPPAITRYYYDGWHVIEERELGESQGEPVEIVRATYVYSDVVDDIVSMRRPSGGAYPAGDYFFHQDDQGNVLLVTDASGAAVERYDYDDFGAPTILDPATGQPRATSAIGNRFLFTGREWDADTKLYHYRFRDYDPATGRFLQRDPIGIWGDLANLGNGTAYVGNNPWSHTDPYGLTARDYCIAIRSWSNRNLPENPLGHYFYGVTTFLTAPLMIGDGAGQAAVGYDEGGKMSNWSRGFAVAGDVADLASLVPGAAALKILSPLKKVDDVADALKTADQVVELADDLSDAARAAKNLERAGDDAADVATDALKTADDVPPPNPGGCFVAGTLVSTSTGLRPIEEIKEGDEVWAMDTETGGVRTARVSKSYRRENVPLVEVELKGGEVLTATPEHPFWVVDSGWTQAKGLRPTMNLRTREGESIEVARAETLDSTATVHNLMVEGLHTYFVGNGAVLVHNQSQSRRAPELDGGHLNEEEFLRAADEYLGLGYTEPSPGRFLSEDGLRQVRFGNHETGTNPMHGHFESYDQPWRLGGRIDENTRCVINPQ